MPAAGIDWITRGSAADSLVCYCLGISNVCPIRFDLYFRRFLNKERMAMNKLPDIDIDFPHDRKDDVVDLLFEKYGPAHCAVVGGFNTFQTRSAFAEVAKVLGVAEREVRRFTEHFPWSFGERQKEEGRMKNEQTSPGSTPASNSSFFILHSALGELLRSSPETRDLPLDEEPYRSTLAMAEFLDGVPRYPKMHPCGVVLSRQPIHELTPTFISGKGWPATHFDMDTIEAVGLVKMDILAQGGLAVMRDARGMLREHRVAVDLERFTARRQFSSSSSSLVLEGKSETTHYEDEDEGRGRNTFQKSPLANISQCAFDDPEIWSLIASGGARAVHHIESPAMTSLCRMTNVRDIDTLIAIVSVIRPGAANEDKKREFTRRYQGLSPVTYPHPSLEPCLRSTFGLVVYEEHILQICEAFAGLPGGRADVLRRALVKEKWPVVAEIGREFVASASARGHSDEKIVEVWKLVTGFHGYAFCKAHSTAYGVEAYQSAWLKRHFPAEFMAGVLTNGKGFYSPLVYVLECWRLGIPMLPPWVNEPGPGFAVKAKGRMQNEEWESGRCARLLGVSSFCILPSAFIRVPVTRIKGLTEHTLERLLTERARGEFASLADFYRRVAPQPEEMEILIRVGALDGFGQSRTRQFWEARWLHCTFGQKANGQGWLLGKEEVRMKNEETNSGRTERGGSDSSFCILPSALLTEPSRLQRLQWEAELLGFPASGHPLELYPDVAWGTYCPVARLGEHVGQQVVTCGLIIEQRVHHQVTGEPMKFLTLRDRTGMVETELFAQTYKTYGLATVRYPVLEVAASVEPFDNGRGFSLRVLRAGKSRTRPSSQSVPERQGAG